MNGLAKLSRRIYWACVCLSVGVEQRHGTLPRLHTNMHSAMSLGPCGLWPCQGRAGSTRQGRKVPMCQRRTMPMHQRRAVSVRQGSAMLGRRAALLPVERLALLQLLQAVPAPLPCLMLARYTGTALSSSHLLWTRKGSEWQTPQTWCIRSSNLGCMQSADAAQAYHP